MSVSNYQPKSNMCRYTYSKLKKVVYLISKEHAKNVHIDDGEAYIEGLTQLPLRLNGFSINLNEESSLDERYQFQKTVTLSLHGYVSHRIFDDRYYVILESEDGTYWMVNVDFPSRVTYTFNLSNNVYQTDFTFASLSNFPTLRLNADFEAVSPECLGLNTYGIQSLKLIERNNTALDTEGKTVYTYGDTFKDIEFLGESCSYSSVYDGFNVTDTITFDIAFSAYKSSWHYNLLEFVRNLYSAIIQPKSSSNTFYSGFNYGLQPNFTVSTSDSNDEGDIITITLREMSSNGLTAAMDWGEEHSTATRWVNVRQVGNVICYECVGNGRARYLVQREVLANGSSTGNYRVLQGYESQYADQLNVTGTFNSQELFDDPSCGGDGCIMTTDMPLTVSFNNVGCQQMHINSTCDWHVERPNPLSEITVTPSSGTANQNYTVTVCNTVRPTGTYTETMNFRSGNSVRVLNVIRTNEKSILTPSTKSIDCRRQDVIFTYNSSCPITVTSIPNGLTYQMTNSQLIVNVPANPNTSSRSFSISVRDCNNQTQTVTISQDKTYERWVDTSGTLCDGTDKYTKQERWTGTTSSSINTKTGEVRTGTLIESDSPDCSNVSTRWTTSQYFICIDGNKWSFEEEELSYDSGATWTKSGITRPLSMVEADSSFCDESTAEYEWRLSTKWQCGT